MRTHQVFDELADPFRANGLLQPLVNAFIDRDRQFAAHRGSTTLACDVTRMQYDVKHIAADDKSDTPYFSSMAIVSTLSPRSVASTTAVIPAITRPKIV